MCQQRAAACAGGPRLGGCLEAAAGCAKAGGRAPQGGRRAAPGGAAARDFGGSIISHHLSSCHNYVLVRWDCHRKAGGVQHLVELLREISVSLLPIIHVHLGLGFSNAAILGIWCFLTLQLGLW
jgi:hypothetical protein